MRRMRFLAGGLLIVAVWPAVALAQMLAEVAKVAPFVSHLDRRSDDRHAACQVTPIEPALNFAIHLQAGYFYRVRLDQYSGVGHGWTALTQITAEDATRPPVYLSEFIKLPEMSPNDMEWHGRGMFLLGEGRYQVKWMMLDDSGRVCRKQWKIDTRRRAEGRGVASLMAANSISDLAGHGLPRVEHPPSGADAPRLTILLDAAPLKAGPAARSELSSRDTGACS